MFRKMFVIVSLFVFASLANAAGIGCEAGLYSKYINGIGGVAGEKKEPVVQGSCRYTTENGYYVDGWLSQSTWKPGTGNTFANEFDLTVGRDAKINKRWSYDMFLAYYDITNNKLFEGVNGDLASVGGTLRYHLTEHTTLFAKVDGFHGIGNRGLKDGWRTGFGASTSFGPVAVTGTVFQNINFLGHGQFIKLMAEPVAPMAKFAGGEIRPTIFLWQPLGSYGKTHDTEVVFAIRGVW